MTQPLVLLAIVVLFVNDHVLKQAFPGVVTGKLSDAAGMIFFPVLLHTVLWKLVPRGRRDATVHDRLLVAACIATVIAFTLTKTTAFANDAYRLVWGAFQWPFHVVRALARGTPLPGLARVILVRDPSDVIAVPFAFLAWRCGRASASTEGLDPTRLPRRGIP